MSNAIETMKLLMHPNAEHLDDSDRVRHLVKASRGVIAELDYEEQRASYNAQVAMGLQSDLVKATKRIEELERFVEYYRKRFFAMRRALRNWPALPDPLVLKQLKYKFPEDWERGKTLQREIRFEAIPPVCECEGGAGFWDRITNGAWREALSTQKGDTDE